MPLMPTLLPRRRPDGRRDERGYVAVMTGLLMIVLIAFCAFAVDVGNWYLTGQRAQRAADAGALGGVTKLPGDLAGAQSQARTYTTSNGFTNGVADTTIASNLDRSPTRLRVTVTRTVNNIFGPLLGVPRTTVSRTAVADYAGPVPMGSPCNQYGTGSDPEGTSLTRASSCSGVQGNYWANINGPAADKQNGDAYASSECNTSVSGRDGCSGSTNTEYDANGYFFTITVKRSMPSLTVQLFDPVHVNTGLTCGFGAGDPNPWGAGTTSSPYASRAVNPWHVSSTSTSDRYARVPSGDASSGAWPWCTGDNLYSSSTQVMNTQFTLRAPSASQWDPMSGAVACQRTYGGHTGNLYPVLNAASLGTYRSEIAEHFRRWSTLCTIAAPQIGDYVLQVKSSVGGAFNNADAGNRYGIRVTGTDLNAINVSGRERMGMYANKNSGLTNFHLARVPTSAAGGILKVILYDVGDSTQSGTIKINPPGGGNYSGCTGSGVTTTINSNCSFQVTAGSPSAFNGRYQTVNVPIPAGYTCDDTNPEACWVTLSYNYGSGAQPTDVTAWAAKLEGDPIRLVE
ncbi:MAG: pilus assembly protein TadG-related protein [Phycicoccus sp.]